MLEFQIFVIFIYIYSLLRLLILFIYKQCIDLIAINVELTVECSLRNVQLKIVQSFIYHAKKQVHFIAFT